MAALEHFGNLTGLSVSTHSHPKVAACRFRSEWQVAMVSTHSHPKVAATIKLKLTNPP
ncbi:hypothetical protein WQG_14160 [Bibersteinia trehalosi USDA-ARS-USMARC-192]|nr:hypothetical protein WQG_14160 [Bibersteinia trehalosi USDA-ARS-USMARC-192]